MESLVNSGYLLWNITVKRQVDKYKSLLLDYSDASNEYGPIEVKRVIENSENFEVAAVAIATVKCPNHIMEWCDLKLIPMYKKSPMSISG